jgi:hypothetical protein
VDEADRVRELGLVELDQATEPAIDLKVAGLGLDEIEQEVNARKAVFLKGLS